MIQLFIFSALGRALGRAIAPRRPRYGVARRRAVGPSFRQVAFAFILLLLMMTYLVQHAHAQGGYTIGSTPPPGYRPTDTHFYMPVIDASTGVEKTILCTVAGYVIYDDPARQVEYLVFRLDDIYVVDDWADPLNAWAGYKSSVIVPRFIPTDQLPQPTFFIFNAATLEQFDLHEPHL